jgi:AraC-like DNA-binding protein
MKRSQINAIAKAVVYFEANLQEEATISEAAELTGYSLYHFCRLFNAIARYSPFHYLIKRRICEAAKELIDTKKNISRIAFEHEFNSPETFSRAFRRILGMLPQAWRKTYSITSANLLMPAFSKDFLRFINQEDFPNPIVKEIPKIDLSGLMSTDKKELLQQFAIEPEYLVSWQSSTRKRKMYFAGFQQNKGNDPDFMQKTFPTRTWLCFKYQKLKDHLDFARIYLHHIWLINSDYTSESDLEVIHVKTQSRTMEFLLPIKKMEYRKQIT